MFFEFLEIKVLLKLNSWRPVPNDMCSFRSIYQNLQKFTYWRIYHFTRYFLS